MDDLEALPITGTLGAELRGPDLSMPLPEKMANAILDALSEYRVVFFRNQPITPDQHLAFSASLGPVRTEYPPYLTMVEGYSGVTILDGGASDAAAFWHSDVSGSATPPMASVLSMKECPTYGGDTLFADMAAAYDALSDRMKAYLEGLSAVHGLHATNLTIRRLSPTGEVPEDVATLSQTSHPLVRTHPVTGRKILFVNPGFTTHIQGVPAVEADSVLEFLFQHQIQPEFQCRWRWQKDDVAIWDNRAVIHYAIGDYGEKPRVLHRTTIEGDAPY